MGHRDNRDEGGGGGGGNHNNKPFDTDHNQ